MPEHWSPQLVEAFLKEQKWKDIGGLLPPLKKHQGWLFSANPAEEDKLVENFGCGNRRYKVYYYEFIDHLRQEDAMYDVVTPQKLFF